MTPSITIGQKMVPSDSNYKIKEVVFNVPIIHCFELKIGSRLRLRTRIGDRFIQEKFPVLSLFYKIHR